MRIVDQMWDHRGFTWSLFNESISLWWRILHNVTLPNSHRTKIIRENRTDSLQALPLIKTILMQNYSINNIPLLFTEYMTEHWISFYLHSPSCRLGGWCSLRCRTLLGISSFDLVFYDPNRTFGFTNHERKLEKCFSSVSFSFTFLSFPFFFYLGRQNVHIMKLLRIKHPYFLFMNNVRH